MKKLFFGNWKMYLASAEEAEALAKAYVEAAGHDAPCEIACAPSFHALERAAAALAGSSVALGAQDGFWEDRGAYTGEVSMSSLASAGVRYVIIGHSERRTLGETDEETGMKAAASARAGLVPVLCVGETQEEREEGRREAVVARQLEAGLKEFDEAGGAELIVAYEPRWAIGTGVPCEPDDAAEMHGRIREFLERRLGDRGEGVRILYGGSVDAENAASYLRLDAVGGVLVGGASVRADQLKGLIEAFR
jgi:triosephosphate isomerase